MRKMNYPPLSSFYWAVGLIVGIMFMGFYDINHRYGYLAGGIIFMLFSTIISWNKTIRNRLDYGDKK